MPVTSESWNTRIQRAEELARKTEATKEILTFYAKLLQSQKEADEFLRSRRSWLPSGSLAEDLSVVRESFPVILRTVEANGPEPLAEEARTLNMSSSAMVDDLLLEYWRNPSDTQFFAKSVLQPYARWLAESGGQPLDRLFEHNERRCPFCGGMPQVSFLQIREATSESGNRDLVCATCTINWSFRRVACAHCGEERPTKLGYFHTPEYDHIRIEACDTCKHYIKGVDLTRLGFAVPLVDEVAAAALDVWAHEHGYTKIELNLIGL
ncbi:MAG TPA: formate dehydrogenase accessory protein FdhE [Pyrinomonadaceae bacterium]|nr:formate dehydrogenase accessory protein FdhE [Pyrinomonadaceae bacterium]